MSGRGDDIGTNLRDAARAGSGYPLAVVVVLGAAVALLPLRPFLEAPTLMLAFVPVIIVLARFFGIGVSALASVLAFFAIDFLYLQPYYRLAVGSFPEWLGLLAFLAVALVSGQQTALLRERERTAERRRAELALLNALTERIASAGSATEIAEFVVARAQSVLGATRAAVYVPGEGSEFPLRLANSGSTSLSAGEIAAAAWVIKHGLALSPGGSDGASGAAPSPATEAVGAYIPLATADGVEGVLHIVVPDFEAQADRISPLLGAMANLVAASFQRQRLEESAARAEALREADRLKTTLVSSVSHELKTPLAAANARITGLLEEPTIEPERLHAELADVSRDLSRLNTSIAALLDLSRLESDAWRPRFELHELDEVLGTVVANLPSDQASRVKFALTDEVAYISCDFAQLARALANVVDNALYYSPPSSPVWVSSRLVGDRLRLTIEDGGPGVSDAEKERIFEKFYRGVASSQQPGGTGLGLAIAYEVVRTHGGSIGVEDAQPTGARFVISLPVAESTEEMS